MTGQAAKTTSLRTLLPKRKRAALSPEPVKAAPASKRAIVPAACEACRTRKIKCDAETPCATCRRMERTCEYRDEPPRAQLRKHYKLVEGQLAKHEELYRILQNRSRPEALGLFHRIRAGSDVETILRHEAHGDLLLQLRLTPESRYRLHLEDTPRLFSDPDDPYRLSPLLDSSYRPASPDGGWEPRGRGRRRPSPAAAASGDIYEKPFHTASLVDSRLRPPNLLQWTNATDDAGLVSKMLSLYFQHEYPELMFFHKDLFLDDMAAGRNRFCSPLLFNAVLAAASHTLLDNVYRARFWDKRNLGYGFMAEAKRLWEFESAQGDITTISAAMILGTRHMRDGTDKIGTFYLEQAVAMGREVGLFTTVEDLDSAEGLARAATAWGVFVSHAIVCQQFLRPMPVPVPPTPLPDYASARAYVGEVYVRYPLAPAPIPTHLGAYSVASFRLRLLTQEFVEMIIKSGSTEKTAPPSGAPGLLVKLKQWLDDLPSQLQPNRVALPHHLTLHMQYCKLVVQVLDWMPSPPPGTPRPIDSHKLSSSLRARFESLVRYYYVRHSFQHTAPELPESLFFFSSLCLAALPPGSSAKGQDSTTLLLCAKGIHDGAQSNYMVTMMFNFLENQIDPTDPVIVNYFRKIRADSRIEEPDAKYIRSEWPVYDQIDPSNKPLCKLIKYHSVSEPEKESVGSASLSPPPS